MSDCHPQAKAESRVWRLNSSSGRLRKKKAAMEAWSRLGNAVMVMVTRARVRVRCVAEDGDGDGGGRGGGGG